MKIFKKNAFGLDIGDSTLKLVHLNSRKEVDSYNYIKLPEGWIDKGVVKEKAKVIESIKQLVSEVKGKQVQTDQVVACLPEPRSFIKIFELPPTIKKNEIKDLVLEQIPINFPLRWDEVYMDWRLVNWKDREKENLKVLVGVSSKDIVAQYVDMIQSAGLQVRGLQIEATAIVNALHKKTSLRSIRKHGAPVEVFVDLGYNRSSIIVADNGIIQFSLSLKNATKNLYKSIAKTQKAEIKDVKQHIMNCGFNQKKCPKEYPMMEKHYSAIAKEIAKAIKFYNQMNQREQFAIILTGGTALTEHLPEFFAEKLKMEVSLGNPFTNCRFRKNETMQTPQAWNVFTSAIGLALSGLIQRDL